MRTVKRILGILLIFLFGLFIGAAVTGAGIMKKTREVMLGGPESIMKVVVTRLDSELKLDAEQKRKLQTIVDDAHIKLHQSQDKIQPEISATLGEAEQRVREKLYRKQLEKFDSLLNRSRERWKAAGKERENGLTHAGESSPQKEDAPKETPKPAESAPAPPAGD